MRSMKRVLSMILVIALTLSLCLPLAHAQDNSIKVMLNGEYVEFDVQPQLVNDRTMVPFRAIFEAMGATVEWNHDLWQAIGEKDGKRVSMIIDTNEVVVNNNGEEKIIHIDQAPILVDGRTLVPVRFVAEAFDKIVAWDNDERTVIIFDLQYFVDKLKEKAPNFYEYISTANAIPENFKANDEFGFALEMKDNETKENVKVSVEGDMESIVNTTDAYVGLDTEIEVDTSDENAIVDFNLDFYFKDSYMIIKTDLLDLMEMDEMEYNNEIYSIKNDGIVIDLQQLGITGVNSFEDLMEMSKESYDIDTVSNIINAEMDNIPMTVQDAKDIIAMYDLMLDLVTDDKFVKKELSTQTMYTWTIDKEDIIDMVIKMFTNGMASDVAITAEELQELNALFKEFEMVTKLYVKDNIPTKAVLDFNMEVAESEIVVTMEMNWNEEITSVNKGPYKISHPDYEKGLDIFGYIAEQDAMYEEAEKEYELSWVQDSVTLYIMNEIYAYSGETKTVEQIVAQIYNENGWTEDAKEKLGLEEEDIDLSNYRLTATGVVERI